MALLKQFGQAPMGGDDFVRQQTGIGEQKHARTGGSENRTLLMTRLQPVGEFNRRFDVKARVHDWVAAPPTA